MSKDIFISYSRRDQEFVARLASDLDAQVAGVWFDQFSVQVGQKWHDEIMVGIRACKAFILVLSPDAVESKYVREEVNKALELGKTIFPILYRPAKWTGDFEALVREIQTLDLRSGSYTDNFHRLVDGLIEVGATKAKRKRSFSRQPKITSLNIVFSKVPGWAVAWGLGWFIFWLAFAVYYAIASVIANSQSAENLDFIVPYVVGGSIGGFTGGLMAGLFTMLALRPNAPSIHWRHMAPAIHIWGISGLLGILPALVITMNTLPAYLTQIAFAVWCFLTGLLAGLLAVRHIRRLEPGITNPQSISVCLGWGCAALVGSTVTFELGSLISTLILR
jgi:hypothetical protein